MDSGYIFKILSERGVTAHLVSEHYRFYFKLSSIVRFIAENSEIVLQAYLDLLLNNKKTSEFYPIIITISTSTSICPSIHDFVFEKLAPILVGMNKNITNKRC